MIDGGPPVLYDAVALLPSEAGVAKLLQHAARDFVAAAFVEALGALRLWDREPTVKMA